MATEEPLGSDPNLGGHGPGKVREIKQQGGILGVRITNTFDDPSDQRRIQGIDTRTNERKAGDPALDRRSTERNRGQELHRANRMHGL